ncbi:hypothetical protein QCA50_013528 [Cerrena zonata]|uniref:C2H2-type domain-containing protein n=1 Tax=Cerrena zonata TaxID=2478898 RepID=A0AAW0G0W1_9APHY
MPPKRLPPLLQRKLYTSRRPVLPCPYCPRVFRNTSGLSQHRNSAHPLAGPALPSHTPNVHFGPSFSNHDQAAAGEGDMCSETAPTEPPVSPSDSDTETNTSSPPPLFRDIHPSLNGLPCDRTGNPLPPETPPPPHTPAQPSDWTPFGNRQEFELAEFLFIKNQASAPDINFLMDSFAAFGCPFGMSPPFADANDMYEVIDSIPLGDAPWHSFTASYNGAVPAINTPEWMTAKYDVWCRSPLDIVRNLLANPDFKGEFDYAPFREYDHQNSRQYHNFMSGSWAWRHADMIVKDDPSTEGALFVPIILGSDKTTVSVATGQNEYYPLYLSIGNIFNNVRRAHRNGVILLGFLSIPKSDRKDATSKAFRWFRRQLFHSSLSTILQPLRKAMSTPEITRCPDGYFRRVIYGLGPYIADYPEQVLASCIVQGWCPLCPKHRDKLDEPGNAGRRSRLHTEELLKLFDLKALWDDYGVVGNLIPFTNDFPRADIHELLSGDILHQVIKGTFKDHLVTWIGDYLVAEHGESKGKEILDEIDRRIAAVPLFAGLRHFHQGRDFKQWTGDDSKALMKVYLPTLVDLVPDDMVRALSAFMEACYIIRRSILSEASLTQLDDALSRFHQFRGVFQDTGVRPNGMSLPRQHSLDHYPRHIREFGAPNGLCSSITESKHIKAVKEPWRRSNRFEALGQMLVTNQRLDKIHAARNDFEARGMLKGSLLSSVLATISGSQDTLADGSGTHPIQHTNSDNPLDMNSSNDDDDSDADPVTGPRVMATVALAQRSVRNIPRSTVDLAAHFGVPNLAVLMSQYLYEQLHPHAQLAPNTPPPPIYYRTVINPRLTKISVFTSAAATFYAPSDISGIGGMRRERIRATPSWRKGPARYDCVLIETDSDASGMRGLHAARVRLLFSFKYEEETFPCALVEWFTPVDCEPDVLTGMWIVEPEFDNRGVRVQSLVHLDTIVRAAHLIPVYGRETLPPRFHFSESLDSFKAYYVNKYVDHHSHEIAF